MKHAHLFNTIFHSRNYPVHNLGRIAVFAFLITFITGIYLFIFYRIDPLEAYNSTEDISGQWIGGIMRSMHRYSSDLLVIAMVLHFLHVFIKGTYRQKFSWLSGLITLGSIIFIGITGFILVWDQKAKLAGLLSLKLLSVLPFFSYSLSGLFWVEDLKSLSGFFRVSFVAHFFLSLFLLVIIYLHVTRIGMRKFLPSSFLMYAITLYMLLISLLFPVCSDPTANTTLFPVQATFDWYFFAGFYSMKFISLKTFWLITILFIATLLLLPFTKKGKIILKIERMKLITHGFSLIFLILFASVPFLSNTSVAFYSSKQKTLILNFKYVSSPTETETYQTDLKHMKYLMPIVKSRSPVEVQVLSEDGEKLYTRDFEPSGIRKNAAIFVYDEILINTDRKIKVRLIEIEIPENRIESPLIDIEPVFVLNAENNRMTPYIH